MKHVIIRGHEIPRIKYTNKERETWRAIFRRLSSLYQKYASAEFLENWNLLQKECTYR